MKRTDAFGLETIRKSVKSYASMLRCFITFAAVGLFTGGVLSASAEDMLLYVGLFRNADSAAQYINEIPVFALFAILANMDPRTISELIAKKKEKEKF